MDVARDLEQLIPGLRITSLGGVCPVQGNGTLRGEPFYFRYRGDHASLIVGPSVDEWDIPDPPRLCADWSGVTGEPLSGSLDAATLTTVFLALVRDLAPPGEQRIQAGQEELDGEFLTLLRRSLDANRDVLARFAKAEHGEE